MNMDKNAVKKEFRKLYATEADHVFSCGGRFEILGNHTDHNHGLCLAATCDLNITAAVKKGSKKGNIVYFQSNGYPTDVVNLDNLYPLDEEKGSSKALIRGIAEYLHTQGYNIGGFTAYSESSIFPGAGVSSSAAFELLVGQIYNDLYNGGQIPRLLLCKAGQYAENRYFGKASGLLDQIGVGFGNISYIDFKNISEPKIQQIPFNFSDLANYLAIDRSAMSRELGYLKEEGFIKDYKINSDNAEKMIILTLKYTDNKERVITGLKRISKPGLRVYAKNDEITKVNPDFKELEDFTFIKELTFLNIS